jgi:Tol biopolymer transport system component
VSAPATQSDRLNSALAGRYRIERELGAGGMATVYLAEDLKHDRKVAIKVLKPELAAVLGAERFVVEIKTTAALQHPHILPLFDSGTADGFLFYVMPWIQGETLRTKLDRETQLGIDEAVRITADIADALQYAHEHGVIHRDIKPENILLANGRPMVADFGIALAVSAAAGGRMTETGLSLGTPHYMSPEQATAEKEISARSDVYSLGSVLYEMLTGNPPHVGSSAQQIIMRIITDVPRPVSEVRKAVPPNVAASVAKSLEKLPADRFESARAFADALKNPGFTTATSAGAAYATSGSRWKQRAAVPLAIASAVLLAAAAWGWLKPEPVPPVLRFDLATGDVPVVANSDVAISPDGSMLAFIGETGSDTAIYLRRLDGEPDFRRLAGTESAVGTPSFSPDNEWIAYRRQSDATIVKVSVRGGGATILATTGGPQGAFAHWGTDQQLVYSGGPTGLRRVPAIGGTPEPLEMTAGAARYSFLLPDGSGVLFSRARGVFLLDFKTDSVTLVAPNGTLPLYVETGHLLYIAQSGGLFAVPFDLRRHEVTGPPVRVVDQVAAGLAQRGYSVSRNGTLVYHEGPSTVTSAFGTPTRLLIKSFAGATDTIRLPAGRRLHPRFSPSGNAVAFEHFARGGATEKDIFTFDLVTGTNTQITFDENNDDPTWSPDGKRIAFTKTGATGIGGDLFVKPADNSGAEQSLLSQPGNQRPTSWLGPDTLLYQSNAANSGQFDLLVLPLKAGSKPVAYLEAPWSETDLLVSPDGKLATYTSMEGGTAEVWIRDFPTGSGKWRVSTNGGSCPRWSQDGKDLYYWRINPLGGAAPTDSLFKVRIDRSPSVVVRTRQFMHNLTLAGTDENWDLHPDGTRFIVVVPDRPAPVAGPVAAPASRYIVVQNWFTELKALTAKAKK